MCIDTSTRLHTHALNTNTWAHTCTQYQHTLPTHKLPLKHPRPGTPRAGAGASTVTGLTSSASWPRSSGFSSVKRSSCSPAMVISCSSSPAQGKGDVSAHGDLTWFSSPLEASGASHSLLMGMGPKSSLHPSTTGTWCFSMSGGHSEPLRWELEVCRGQAVPREAQLPAPTQGRFSQLRTDLSPRHGLRQTGRPTWSVRASCLCKHSIQGKSIPIPTPASSIGQREKMQCFGWF